MSLSKMQAPPPAKHVLPATSTPTECIDAARASAAALANERPGSLVTIFSSAQHTAEVRAITEQFLATAGAGGQFLAVPCAHNDSPDGTAEWLASHTPPANGANLGATTGEVLAALRGLQHGEGFAREIAPAASKLLADYTNPAKTAFGHQFLIDRLFLLLNPRFPAIQCVLLPILRVYINAGREACRQPQLDDTQIMAALAEHMRTIASLALLRNRIDFPTFYPGSTAGPAAILADIARLRTCEEARTIGDAYAGQGPVLLREAFDAHTRMSSEQRAYAGQDMTALFDEIDPTLRERHPELSWEQRFEAHMHFSGGAHGKAALALAVDADANALIAAAAASGYAGIEIPTFDDGYNPFAPQTRIESSTPPEAIRSLVRDKVAKALSNLAFMIVYCFSGCVLDIAHAVRAVAAMVQEPGHAAPDTFAHSVALVMGATLETAKRCGGARTCVHIGDFEVDDVIAAKIVQEAGRICGARVFTVELVPTPVLVEYAASVAVVEVSGGKDARAVDFVRRFQHATSGMDLIMPCGDLTNARAVRKSLEALWEESLGEVVVGDVGMEM